MSPPRVVNAEEENKLLHVSVEEEDKPWRQGVDPRYSSSTSASRRRANCSHWHDKLLNVDDDDILDDAEHEEDDVLDSSSTSKQGSIGLNIWACPWRRKQRCGRT